MEERDMYIAGSTEYSSENKADSPPNGFLNFVEFLQNWRRDCPMYEIYQIRDGTVSDRYRFQGTRYLKKQGITVNGADYDIKYAAPLKEFEGRKTLEEIYIALNQDGPPFDYRGFSLSVSDVVVVRTLDWDAAYYVEPYGFKEMDSFLRAREVKDPLEGIYDNARGNEIIARRNLSINQEAAFKVGDMYFEIQDTGEGNYLCSFFDEQYCLRSQKRV